MMQTRSSLGVCCTLVNPGLRSVAPRQPLHLSIDHHAHQLGEGDARRPAEALPGLARIAAGLADIDGTKEARVCLLYTSPSPRDS